MDKALLFIPCYNCENQIIRVLDQIDDEVLSYFARIIVVNNRSTDSTEQVVINWIKQHNDIPIALLRNDDNYSLGGSHKVAFEYAIREEFDYVVVLHGDDQGNIHDALPLLRNNEYRNYDCCLGSRFMKGSMLYGYSPLRICGNHILNLWFSIVTGQHMKDLGSGLNFFKVSTLKSRFFYKYPDKMFFNGVIVLSIAYYNRRVLFFPISWREDDQVSNVKLFNIGMDLLKMTFSYLLRRKSYMTGDMREIRIDNYTYEIVYDNLNEH